MNTQAASSRRRFLKSISAVATVAILPRHVLGGPKHVAPSDRVNVALVGAGGRGLQNARELMNLADVRITAIADPAEFWDLNNFYYQSTAGRRPAAELIEQHYRAEDPEFRLRVYSDYREMLSEEQSLDAVLCATPDHAHAVVSLDAMRSGRHVYCEKPLTHNVVEARLVAKVARETGVATQMGNQGHSREGIRRTCEIVWSGLLGDITHVHAWVPASRWNPALLEKPTEAQPIPDGFDWDLWCGPRTPPPYHSVYTPVSWRDFWTFGCGALGDFGCHDLDSAVWALDLVAPESVQFHPAGAMTEHLAPHGEIGYYTFQASGKQRSVNVTWYSGGLKPDQPDLDGRRVELPSRGVLFVGTRGLMVCGGAGGDPIVYPEGLRGEVEKIEPSLPRSNGHHRDWIDAIKGGSPASSNFEYGARLTEITLLGLVALRTGQRIAWNPETMDCGGVAGAEEILRGTYRPGWQLT